MGFFDKFKKQERTEADIVLEKIQMVDGWLIQNNKSYKIQFDTTVPMETGRRKEYTREEMLAKCSAYEQRFVELMNERELGSYLRDEEGMYDKFDMYGVHNLHKWMQRYGDTILWLASYAPSTVFKRNVMFDEALAYFNDVFMKTEPLCEEIQVRLQKTICELVFPETIGEESTAQIYEDYQDVENCEKLMHMMVQMFDYFYYTLELLASIYANAPYLLDNEMNYQRIENVEKTFANVFRMMRGDYGIEGCITQEQFLELVE